MPHFHATTTQQHSYQLLRSPVQLLDVLEAFEVQDEAGRCRADLDALLRLLVAAAALALKLVRLGKHLRLAAARNSKHVYSL
jgi:hypothetical protein